MGGPVLRVALACCTQLAHRDLVVSGSFGTQKDTRVIGRLMECQLGGQV